METVKCGVVPRVKNELVQSKENILESTRTRHLRKGKFKSDTVVAIRASNSSKAKPEVRWRRWGLSSSSVKISLSLLGLHWLERKFRIHGFQALSDPKFKMSIICILGNVIRSG